MAGKEGSPQQSEQTGAGWFVVSAIEDLDAAIARANAAKLKGEAKIFKARRKELKQKLKVWQKENKAAAKEAKKRK